MAAAAQANAGPAKACLAFVERKLNMKMRLEKLQLEKENAAAIAKAETLKAVTYKLNKQGSCSHLRFNLMPANPEEIYLIAAGMVSPYRLVCNIDLFGKIKLEDQLYECIPNGTATEY